MMQNYQYLVQPCALCTWIVQYLTPLQRDSWQCSTSVSGSISAVGQTTSAFIFFSCLYFFTLHSSLGSIMQLLNWRPASFKQKLCQAFFCPSLLIPVFEIVPFKISTLADAVIQKKNLFMWYLNNLKLFPVNF